MKSLAFLVVGLGALAAWLVSVCLGIAWGVVLPVIGFLYVSGFLG